MHSSLQLPWTRQTRQTKTVHLITIYSTFQLPWSTQAKTVHPITMYSTFQLLWARQSKLPHLITMYSTFQLPWTRQTYTVHHITIYNTFQLPSDRQTSQESLSYHNVQYISITLNQTDQVSRWVRTSLNF